MLVIYQSIIFNDGKTHLVFCNVGQGDAIFIRSIKGLNILIDGGPDDSVLGCLSRHMPFWERKISLVILTHPHADHMTGLISVLKDYKVGSFATEKLINNTSIYNKLLQYLKNDNLRINYLFAGDLFETQDLNIKILGPTSEFLQRANPMGVVGESKESGSLTTLLSIGGFDAILTGDTPIEEFNEEINDFSVPKISIFQISHHGSVYNTDSNLISEISPKLAVISVGKNNYGHPSQNVINILNDLKIPFLRTDKHGDIEVIADKNGDFLIR